MNPYQKRQIRRIIPFGLLWGGGAFLYSLLEKGILGSATHYPSTGNPYEFFPTVLVTVAGAMIMGWIMGAFEVSFFGKLFDQRSFGTKIIIKTGIYLVVIVSFLFTTAWLGNSLRMGLSPLDPLAIETVMAFFLNFAFFSIMVYTGSLIGLVIFISDVSENIGMEVLKNYLVGKYHHPREERRIFMFVDIKSSTTIAEKLGHLRYFELLKKYYADLSEVIIQTSGEIYQYVGDEIIISWKMENGITKNNCVRCFFLMKEKMERVAPKYLKEFDLAPQFKAGLHQGKVTTGEIGVIKRNIIFTGDILNTTARIQGSCNQYQVDNLISENLLSKLKIEGIFRCTEIGEVELKGKNKKVKLFTLGEIPKNEMDKTSNI